jgi:hypothetical protein
VNAASGAPNPGELSQWRARRCAARDCLATILADARRGELPADWRTQRLSAALAAVEQHPVWGGEEVAVDPLRLPASDPDDSLSPLKELGNGPLGLQAQMSTYFTLLDVITTCPAAAWEPGVGGSARAALDAWYAAAMLCVVEAGKEIPAVPEGDDERSVRTRLSVGRVWARWRAENQRDADLLTESYEAALVSVGAGDSGWVERSRRRVANWPDSISFSRSEHLWMLDDPLYVTSREWLPAYWSDHR